MTKVTASRLIMVLARCANRLEKIIEEEGYQEKAHGFEECLNTIVEEMFGEEE